MDKEQGVAEDDDVSMSLDTTLTAALSTPSHAQLPGVPWSGSVTGKTHSDDSSSVSFAEQGASSFVNGSLASPSSQQVQVEFPPTQAAPSFSPSGTPFSLFR